MQYALWPSIPWETDHGFYRTAELGTLSNRSSTVCVQQVNYCTTELGTLFNRSRGTTVMLLLSIFYCTIKSVGLRALFKTPHTEKLICCPDYLDHWVGNIVQQVKWNNFLCCCENFLSTHTSKVWNKNFLNVNIGGKASKKLKSGSKMVCSCHLAEQQLLSGFDG